MNDFQIDRLKKRIGKVNTPITDEELLSLLARLEAAEPLVVYAGCCCPKEAHYENCKFPELMDAWFKSKGEGDR